jgi:hypothetical protein
MMTARSRVFPGFKTTSQGNPQGLLTVAEAYV